jgi:hypothetical protein
MSLGRVATTNHQPQAGEPPAQQPSKLRPVMPKAWDVLPEMGREMRGTTG